MDCRIMGFWDYRLAIRYYGDSKIQQFQILHSKNPRICNKF